MRFVPSPEQQAVIDHGLSPLRVTAGAGTGKTSTLAYRMARLIERSGVLPEQVLGVTFTNKAADELARRIRSVLISTTPGQEIDVFTYHGFAAHLLGDYGVLVGMDRDTRIITPTASRQVLRECVFATSFELVDATNVTGVISRLLELSGELADNLIAPDALLASPPTDEVEARRVELATALVEFEARKRRMGVRDYGDLIRLAVDLARRHPGVVDRVRARYRCVLLDEFQDTNPAQRELFTLLFGRGTAVTAVGDLDQTIYEWRGASPANFEFFPGGFREAGGAAAPTLRLSVNRRSAQRILDVANRMRAKISVADRAADLKALPGAPFGEVNVAWYADGREEAEEIAREAQRLHETGAAWSEMAVLFRRNRDMELVRLALDEHGIPLQVTDLGGLLQVPEIVELHAWMRILDDPTDGAALVRILLGSQFRLGLSDLAPLSRWVRERSFDQDGELYTLVEALEHLSSIEAHPDILARLSRFQRLHRTLMSESQGAGPSEVARMVLSRTGAWQEIDAMPSPSDISARLNVHRFLDFTEQWRPLKGESSLPAFLDHLTLMRDNPIDGLDTARVAGEDAVTLTTVHRAKGLEWRVVFLPALYRGNFPASPRGLRDPSRYESSLPAPLRIDPEFRANLDPSVEEKDRREWLRGRHEDQEWRLAYVAVTRAKESLYLSGAHWYGIPEPLKRPSKPSPLIETARRVNGTVIDRWMAEPPPRPETLRFSAAQPGPDPVLEATWEEALHQVLDDPDWAAARAEDLGIRRLYDQAVNEFEQGLLAITDPTAPDPDPGPTTVSVTGLVTYAQCPKRYFWSEVDRLPRRPPPGARRGTELHRRIELHNRGMVPFDDLTDDLYDRSPDEDTTAPAVTGDGWSTFLESPYATRTPVHVEVPFEIRVSEDAWIRGRVDAVYPDAGNGWEIVDFKSGRRSDRPSAGVQLQAYAVAADEGGLGSPPAGSLRASFVYLGRGLEVVDEDVDERWLQQARERIHQLLDGIQSEQFEPSPSTACRTCDFRTFCEEGRAFLERSDQP